MGVMALVIVLSVMNGFRADLMSKILGVNAHLVVLNSGGPFGDYDKIAETLDGIDGVVASSPFILTQVMVNNSGNVSGVVLRGIDAKSVGKVLEINHMIKEGSLDSLDGASNGRPIIIGSELSRHIGARLGDTLTMVSPEGRLTPFGRTPNTRNYVITAIFDSGMYEYDAQMVYISLKEAQDFLSLGDKITGFGVRVKDIFKADTIAENIRDRLDINYRTRDWKEMNRSLFSALKLEKITMFVILTMIVLVGALNIISTLVMVVMEKTRDIAILMAMGASSRSIMSIFIFQGLMVGVVGTIAGLLSGLGLCHMLKRYEFINLDPSVYYISTLPVSVEWGDVWFVSLAAVVISFLATLYPSWHASRLNPVEALRYE